MLKLTQLQDCHLYDISVHWQSPEVSGCPKEDDLTVAEAHSQG